MKFTISKQDDGDGGYEILEPNTYTFTILGVDTQDDYGEPFVARTGVQYVKVKACEKETGLRLTHCIFLDPQKSKKVYYFLKAIGLEPVVGEEIELNFEDWTSRMFRGKVDVKDGKNNIVATYGFSQTQPEVPSELADPITYEKPTTTPDPDLEEDVPF